MSAHVPGPLPGRRTIQTVPDRGVVYEQRFNTCGKPTCTRCNGSSADNIGHGPYWYFCVPVKGKWVRIYLGKHLDTARFRDDAGDIDWAAVFAQRGRRKRHPAGDSQAEPKTTPDEADPETDTSEPPSTPNPRACYVCGRPMDELAADRIDPPAWNLCTCCHVHGHQPEESTADLALAAPPASQPDRDSP